MFAKKRKETKTKTNKPKPWIEVLRITSLRFSGLENRRLVSNLNKFAVCMEKTNYLFHLSHFSYEILGISTILQLREVIRSRPVQWPTASSSSGSTRKPWNSGTGTLAQISLSGTKVWSSSGDTLTGTVETQASWPVRSMLTSVPASSATLFPLCTA